MGERVPTASPDELAPEPDGFPPPASPRSLRQAVITAAALIVLVGAASLFGTGGFFILICVAIAVALFEVFDALVDAGRRPVTTFALACALGLQVVSYAARPELLIVVISVTAVGAFLLSLRPGRGPTPASDAAWTLLAVTWIGGGGAGATSILVLDDGLALLLAFIGVAAADDIAAYFVGSRIGRRKLAPSISPAKTWEGFAGGLVAAIVAGLAAATLVEPLTPIHGIALGAICGIFAPAGDLLESIFKRELKIKDSGRLLPGHGGVLDRLDAIIFCAPLVYLYAFVALP